MLNQWTLPTKSWGFKKVKFQVSKKKKKVSVKDSTYLPSLPHLNGYNGEQFDKGKLNG